MSGEQQPRPPGVPVGRVLGVPVVLAPSWFVVAALITVTLAPTVQVRVVGIGGLAYVVSLAFAVLLYGSVLLHELSHCVVALRFGLPVRRITLQLLGGLSEIGREPETPRRELLVAAAGPAVSLAVGVGATLLARALPEGTVVLLLAQELAVANLLVGLFNLLPGLPLDGGRMLRAAVWRATARPDVGTRVAAWAGRGVAILVLVSPVIVMQAWRQPADLVTVLWAAFVASFIWIGSSGALQALRVRERLPGTSARSLARRAVSVAAQVPLAEALRRAQSDGADAIVVVDGADRPVALVVDAAVGAVPEVRRPWVAVGSVARSLAPGSLLDVDLSGEELLRAMQERPADAYVLVDRGLRVVGVLHRADVERALTHA